MSEGVVAQVWRVQYACGHRLGQGMRIDQWIVHPVVCQLTDGGQRQLCFVHQFFFARLDDGVGRHVWLTTGRVFDRAPGQLARFDHVFRRGSVMGFGVRDDVHDGGWSAICR